MGAGRTNCSKETNSGRYRKTSGFVAIGVELGELRYEFFKWPLVLPPKVAVYGRKKLYF